MELRPVAQRLGALVQPGVHVSLGGSNAVRGPFTCLKALGVPIDTFGTEQFETDQVVAELLA